MPNHIAISTCELLGGFVEGDVCIFREIYIVNAKLDCEGPPLFGKRIKRFMTNEESMTTLGIKHKCGGANYALYEVPVDNVLDIHWRTRDFMVNHAAYRIQKRDEYRKWWISATPEEKEEYLARVKEHNKQKCDSMSPKEKEKYLARWRKYKKQKYDSMPPKEKEEYLAKGREYYDSMSSEEKAEYLNRKREQYASMSPEKKVEYLDRKRKRHDSMSPKEKEEYLAKRRNYYYQKNYGMSEEEFNTLPKEKQKKLGDKPKK